MKEGSPLEALFRSTKIGKARGQITEPAVVVKGKNVLVPEVVLRGDIEIGRYEVTRAQYAWSLTRITKSKLAPRTIRERD